MTTRPAHVRVTLNGNDPVLELMQGDCKACDVTRADVLTMLLAMVEWLIECQGMLTIGPLHLAPSKVDVIDMTANFASTLRWCQP